ncbi:MAG TPA: porin family protein [Flavitalea sp.]|nr:porin family protein [Flavitalea sp.]
MKQQFFSPKSLMAVLLGLVTTMSVSAQVQQTSSEPKMTPKIGIKGGVNFSNFFIDDVKDNNVKTGLNLGLFAKLPVSHGVSIQPELLYSSKGAKVSYNNPLVGGEYRFNLNYLELPVLAVFNLGKNFNIHAGGYAAYLTSANVKSEDNGSSNESLIDFDEEQFNRFDYGLVGGIGFDIKNVSIGARYNYGLNQIGEKNQSVISSEVLRNAKNNNISLYVGYGF